MTIIPTAHMNGTSAEELIRQARAAINAADTLIDMLRGMAPNGRDYYPQGPDAIVAAVAEHRERVRLVDQVQAQLTEIAIGINRQRLERP